MHAMGHVPNKRPRVPALDVASWVQGCRGLDFRLSGA